MDEKDMSKEEAERQARMERARQAAAERLAQRKGGTASQPAGEAPQAAKPAAASQPAAQSGKKYVVKSGDTLGAIALNFYGSAARDKWMKIYEANKAVIGDNPSLIRPGQELVIPEE